MNNEKLLKYFAHVANVSNSQTLELFELCDNDFEKLMELQAKRKDNSVFSMPATKETVNEVLSLNLKK